MTEGIRAKRGFAVMDPAVVSAIAHKGGKAAHVKGTAHEFSTEEAKAAGAKGGRATHAKRRAALASVNAPVIAGATSDVKELDIEVHGTTEVPIDESEAL